MTIGEVVASPDGAHLGATPMIDGSTRTGGTTTGAAEVPDGVLRTEGGTIGMGGMTTGQGARRGGASRHDDGLSRRPAAVLSHRLKPRREPPSAAPFAMCPRVFR